MEIRHIKYEDVNLSKWDDCIKNSFNGNVFAFSWFLDITCESWDALVEGDYVSVMPLPVKKRFGLSSIYTPNFATHLGIFSSEALSSQKVLKFLKSIPSNFLKINLAFNNNNKLEPNHRFEIRENTNFALDLIQPYSRLQAKYKKPTQAKIEQARTKGISISEGVNSHEFLTLLMQTKSNTVQNEIQEIQTLRKLIAINIRFRLGILLGAYSAQNSLVAAGFIVSGLNRNTFISLLSTTEGDESNAAYMLIDHFINAYSQKNTVLDIHKNTTHKNHKALEEFGATNSSYSSIAMNRLPWPFSKLKKH